MNWKKHKSKKWVKKISAKNLKTKTPIDSGAYLHSVDKAALESLQKIPFFDKVLAKYIEVVNERSWKLVNMSEKIQITKGQFPRVYAMTESICKKLGIEIPDLFLELNREPKAYTYGNKKVFITITSGLLECLEEDELYAVLAHECGHIACKHTLYLTMGRLLLSGGELGAAIWDGGLIGKLITTPFKLAFYHWKRCSEYSADRAAMLCCESGMPVVKTMMRLAGGTAHLDEELSVDLFVKQAADYKEMVALSKVDKAMEYLMNYDHTHPLLSVRAREILEWEKSKEYKAMIS